MSKKEIEQIDMTETEEENDIEQTDEIESTPKKSNKKATIIIITLAVILSGYYYFESTKKNTPTKTTATKTEVISTKNLSIDSEQLSRTKFSESGKKLKELEEAINQLRNPTLPEQPAQNPQSASPQTEPQPLVK